MTEPVVNPLINDESGVLYSIAVCTAGSETEESKFLGYVAIDPFSNKERVVLDPDAKWEIHDAHQIAYARRLLQQRADEMMARQTYIVMKRTYKITFSDRSAISDEELEAAATARRRIY